VNQLPALFEGLAQPSKGVWTLGGNEFGIILSQALQ